MRKKANIEQELQGAIAALKKPNPRMAVKELVEAAEQRADRAKTKSEIRVHSNVTILTPSQNPPTRDRLALLKVFRLCLHRQLIGERMSSPARLYKNRMRRCSQRAWMRYHPLVAHMFPFQP